MALQVVGPRKQRTQTPEGGLILTGDLLDFIVAEVARR